MKKILLNLIISVLLIGIVSAINLGDKSICYQETANVSTSCGGLNTGYYNVSIVPYYSYYKNNFYYLYDADWTTTIWDTSVIDKEVNFTFVYKKPLTAINATWKVGRELNNYSSSSDLFYNDSFSLSDNCYNNGKDSLSFKVVLNELYLGGFPPNQVYNVTLRYYCNGLTSDELVYTNNTYNLKGYYMITEEGIYWNMTTLIENNQTFSSSVQGITTNPFTLNVTYDPTYYTSISATLNYNNTIYSSSQSPDGTNTIFSTSATSPFVTGNTNVPFYWIISLTDSTGTYQYNSSNYTQQVTPFAIDDCTSYHNLIFNFTNWDEDARTILLYPTNNNTLSTNVNIYSSARDLQLSSYAVTKSNVNSLSICSNNAVSGTYSVDATVQYSSTDHVTEYYNLQYYILNSSTVNKAISLYDLLTTNSQEFKISVKDANYLALQNAVIEINRKYTGSSSELLVEAPLTDSLGTTIGHFVVNDVTYDIYIKKNGQILASFLNIKVYCNPAIADCVLPLNIQSASTSPIDFKTQLGINYKTRYNSTLLRYYLDFTSADGTSKSVELKGILVDNYGNTTVCDQTIIGLSGTPTCIIDPQYTNKTITMVGYVNGQQLFTDYVTVSYSHSNVLMNARYILAAFLIIPLVVIIFSASVGFAGIGLVLGLILCVGIYMIDTTSILGGTSFIVWLIVAVAIIIWKQARGGLSNG